MSIVSNKRSFLIKRFEIERVVCGRDHLTIGVRISCAFVVFNAVNLRVLFIEEPYVHTLNTHRVSGCFGNFPKS